MKYGIYILFVKVHSSNNIIICLQDQQINIGQNHNTHIIFFLKMSERIKLNIYHFTYNGKLLTTERLTMHRCLTLNVQLCWCINQTNIIHSYCIQHKFKNAQLDQSLTLTIYSYLTYHGQECIYKLYIYFSIIFFPRSGLRKG